MKKFSYRFFSFYMFSVEYKKHFVCISFKERIPSFYQLLISNNRRGAWMKKFSYRFFSFYMFSVEYKKHFVCISFKGTIY